MPTEVAGGRLGRRVRDGIDSQQRWLDPLAERLQQGLSAALTQGAPAMQRVKDALNGTWLGHSLHPALSDVPIGAWCTSVVFDLIGEERGADAALTLGVIAAVPTAAAGFADWQDQADEPRRLGLVHAFLNSAALVCFLGSILARRTGHRSRGIGLSTVGLALTGGSAYLGGELVYSRGTAVDRNAWDPTSEGYQVAASASDLLEDQLTPGTIEVDGKKLPLVLLRRGGQILALGGVCSHVGGPLADGKLVDGSCVVCPWHGSTFDMRTGEVIHGPSPYPQPAYEAREQQGNIEVRLKR